MYESSRQRHNDSPLHPATRRLRVLETFPERPYIAVEKDVGNLHHRAIFGPKWEQVDLLAS